MTFPLRVALRFVGQSARLDEEAFVVQDDVIFVRRGEDLVSLAAAPYEAEAVLQGLLEHHPQLLAGYQMSRDDPRRFLLVCREAPVADHEGGDGRWSIDHVFVDQDGIPTLVEVKRSSDTRIRREVVGQMLDYAANGVRYWGDGALQQLFERTCADNDRAPASVLEEVIGPEADAEDFWARAERNLRGGALRLVFVADVIPDELAAVIEFLNGRMHDTEVHGVEVRHYGNAQTAECFVPRLIGATAAAETTKRSQTSLDEMLQSAGAEVMDVAERLRVLAGEVGLSVVSAAASLRLRDRLGAVVLLYPTYNSLEFPLAFLWQAGRETEIGELRDALQMIAGTSKQVSPKVPNVGCREALAHWEAVVAVVRRLVRIRAENMP
jgi:hypothetical protein